MEKSQTKVTHEVLNPLNTAWVPMQIIVPSTVPMSKMSTEHNALAQNPSLVMNGVILGYDNDGDHVPDLGVKGVHEHV